MYRNTITKINSQELRESVAKSLNLSNFTEQQQEKIIFALMGNVSSMIAIAVWKKLSAKDRAGLKKISGEGEFLKYVSSKIENFEGLVEQITKETTDEFKELRRNRAR